MLQSRVWRQNTQDSFFLRGPQSFLSRPLTDQRRPTHVMEGAVSWVFMSSQNSCVETYSPAWRWNHWEVVGHEGEVIMNKIIALIKETLERFLSPPGTWGYSKKTSVNQEVGPHQTWNLLKPWSWTWSLQNCETCLLFVGHLVYGILFKQPTWTKTEGNLLYLKSTYWNVFTSKKNTFTASWLMFDLKLDTIA